MKIASIIILAVILVLTISLVTFLMAVLQKYRKKVINDFVRDLNDTYQNSQLKKIAKHQLSIVTEDINQAIYFCSKVVVGQYHNPTKVINAKNFNVSNLLVAKKLETFYHDKIINFGRRKFVPIDKFDLLITKDKLYLQGSAKSETIILHKVKNITIFWEKNILMASKDFFPGIGFNYQKRNYFLLFQTYNEVLAFLACLNLV